MDFSKDTDTTTRSSDASTNPSLSDTPEGNDRDASSHRLLDIAALSPLEIADPSSLKFKCIIIDHDDTAVDSTAHIHWPAHLEVAKVLRPEVEPIGLDDFHTINFDPGYFHYVKETFNYTSEELAFCYAAWTESCRTKKPDFYHGFLDALVEYRLRGGKIVVATLSVYEAVVAHYTAHTEQKYDKIGRPMAHAFPDTIFDQHLGPDRRKPETYAVDYVMKEYNLKPSEILVVDDNKPGIEMAKRSRVKSAGVGYSHRNSIICNYLRSNCDYFLHSVDDFRNVINSPCDTNSLVSSIEAHWPAEAGAATYPLRRVTPNDKTFVAVDSFAQR